MIWRSIFLCIIDVLLRPQKISESFDFHLPELVKDDMNSEKGIWSWCPNTPVCRKYRFTKVTRVQASFAELSCLKMVPNGNWEEKGELIF